jgi:hypothetical protein
MRTRQLAVLAPFLLVASLAHAATYDADVVIYGNTPAGIAAAIQTARMGKKPILVTPQKRLGGMTTNGLGATDSGNKAVIGGIAREFYSRVKQHYDDPAAWTLVKRDQYAGYRPKDDAMWYFEPHVAEQLLETMLREANVPIVREQRLTGVTRGATAAEPIAAMQTEPAAPSKQQRDSGEKHQYRGRIFIDATYEGDLMAAAGVKYTVGREPQSQYGEKLNGVRTLKNVKNHRFLVPVSAYKTPGDPNSGLVWGVADGDSPGAEGAGDRRVQAYCYRLCMSNVPENRVPFPKPEGYDESQYELLFRNFEAGDLRVPMHPLMMPNGKTDTNNNGAFSTDNIGMNYDYPEGDYQRRAKICGEHQRYQQGLMWTLANHPRVPEKVRRQMAQWGLAKDEFTDNANWPTEIYVREARRLVSDYVMAEDDCLRKRVAEDSIGMGSYNMDSHNVQRYVKPDGRVQNEGDVQESTRGPYVISYRSIVPRRGEAPNLFVPVCLSASHIAYGSIRMEPVFFILGQSAATAACQAIDASCAVQDVDYEKLKERLSADGQVLTFGR